MFMNTNNTKRSSTKQIQTSMFFGNLRKEMDKMAQKCHKDDLVKNAKSYIGMGLSKNETEELLKLDGYDSEMVHSLMCSASFSEDFAEDLSQKWGFDLEDIYGRIYSNSDFGITISASTEKEACDKAEEEIEKFSTIQLDRIVDVYKI